MQRADEWVRPTLGWTQAHNHFALGILSEFAKKYKLHLHLLLRCPDLDAG